MKSAGYEGIHAENGLPGIGYTFADGRISAVIERHGGLAELAYLPVLKKRSTLMPNQMPLPIFGQGWTGEGERLYAPVVRFLSVQADGAVLAHAPLEDAEIFPFGCRGLARYGALTLGYRFAVGDGVLAWRFENPSASRDSLKIVVHSQGLFSGSVRAVRDQKDLAWVDPALWKTAEESLAWKPFTFIKNHGVLLAEGELTTPEGVEPIRLVIAARAPLACDNEEYPQVLSLPWKRSRRGVTEVFLIWRKTFAACLAKLQELRRAPGCVMKTQLKRFASLDRKIPRLDVSRRPAAGAMSRQLPAQMESLVVTETPAHVTVRAASRGYGVFWCWDMLQPARAFALWGRYERAKKILDFCLGPGAVSNAFDASLVVIAAHDVHALTGDDEFLRARYRKLRARFLPLAKECSTDGMPPVGCGVGLDHPEQLGIRGPVYTPDITGAWYNACRLMENSAAWMGDDATAGRAGKLARSIEENFLRFFFDPAVGALSVAYDPKTGKRNTSFQNVTTFALDGPFGHLLVSPVVNDLARFLSHTLKHPRHRTAVPYWDKGFEMWKNCIMLFHSTHECRVLRRAGATDELARSVDFYLDLFRRHGIAMETVNLTPCPDNTGQEMKTQALTIYAWWRTLLNAVFGLVVDRGGLACEPGDFPDDGKLSGWKIAGATWDIEIRGRGRWLRRIVLDGRPLVGTYKLPPVRRGRHSLLLVRGEEPPPFGTILAATDGKVLGVELGRGRTRVVLSGAGRIPAEFYAETEPEATWRGKPVPVTWDQATATARVECPVKGKGELVIRK